MNQRLPDNRRSQRPPRPPGLVAVWLLVGWLLVQTPVFGQGSPDVYHTLSHRIMQRTLAGVTPATPLDSLLLRVKPDGSWPDLDYADTTRSRWQPGIHWERLLLLTQVFRLPGHPAYNHPALKKRILSAIGYWNSVRPVCPNLWWNLIGVPQKMGETLLLMASDLSPDQQSQTLALLKRGIKPTYYDFNGPATGQNQIWLATIHLMSGLLEHDSTTLRRAFGAMAGEIKVTTAEGIQADGSFHQHGPLLYSGGYGLAFTRDLAWLMRLADGTPYAFPADKKTLFANLILDGQQWMIRGGTGAASGFDHSAVGREIVRPQSANGKLPGGLAAWGQLLTELSLPRRAEINALANRLAGRAAPVLSGNRHFWRSDYLVHHRAGYISSVRMASVRTKGSESGNGENEQGYYLGQGVQFIYRTGSEYRNLFPVWDWQRLPGHLCEQSPEPLPPIPWGQEAAGNTTFVGGASDGIYGLLAGEYRRGNVRAKRAWFHFDGEIVCLGTGLFCPTDFPLFQSINQCHLTGDVTVSSGTSAPRTLPEGDHALPPTHWVLHDSVGYVFPETPAVHVRNAVQTGSWRDINRNPAQSDAELRLPVFSVWLDLGSQVRDKTYFYLIRPGVSAADLEGYQSPIVLLRNDSLVQAVRHSALNQVQAVFYQAGLLRTDNGLTISVDKPMMLLAVQQPDALLLTVSNPAGSGFARLPGSKALTVEVSINRHLRCPDCRWSAGSQTTTLRAKLPENALAGKSVTIRLNNP